VDLKLMQAEPSAEERAAVDELLGPPESAWDGAVERTSFDHRVARGGQDAREDRHLLLPALHAVQHAERWLSPESLERVAAHLRVPKSEVWGVASHYPEFRLTAPGRRLVRVCTGLACVARGARDLLAACEKTLGVRAGRTTGDGAVTLAPTGSEP